VERMQHDPLSNKAQKEAAQFQAHALNETDKKMSILERDEARLERVQNDWSRGNSETGCAWKDCQFTNCPLCLPPLTSVKIGQVNTTSRKCDCGCECHNKMPPKPDGSVWMDTDKETLGKGSCAIEQISQIALCNSGKKVIGCLGEDKVEYSCGCDSLYKWSFDRSQQIHTPLKCNSDVVIPPDLTSSDKSFSKWYQVCKLGMQVTTLPWTGVCRKAEPVANASAASSLGESASYQHEAGRMLHPGFFRDTRAKLEAPGLLSKVPDIPAQSCFAPGYPCRAKLEAHVEQDTAKQMKNMARYGYEFAPGHRKWMKFSYTSDSKECGAIFGFGLAVCNRGHKVIVECDADQSGDVRKFEIGCGCDGIFAQGRVRGFMAHDTAKFCSAQMQEWSQEAEKKYMRVEPAEVCVALAERNCRAAAESYASSEKLSKARVTQKNKWKFQRFNAAVNAITGHNKAAEEVERVLRLKLANSEYKYAKVPGFGFSEEDALAKIAGTNGECADLCNQQSVCKAYTYNRRTKQCAISTVTLGYDDDFVLYLKGDPMGQNPASYKAVPGMRLKTDTNSDDKASEVTIRECEYQCFKSDKCAAISFSQSKQLCVPSSDGVVLGSDWDYYEKGQLKVASREKNFFDSHYMASRGHLAAKAIKNSVNIYKAQVGAMNVLESHEDQPFT